MIPAHARLDTVRAERATCWAGVGVPVGQVTGERSRISPGQYLGVLAHPDLDLAVQDQEQLAGTRRVRRAGVTLARPERPVPQLGDVRRLGARHEHGLPAELAPPQHRGSSRARVTRSPGERSISTSAGSPMPSASLISSSVAMLGLAEPCSMLTSILRLTPQRSAS